MREPIRPGETLREDLDALGIERDGARAPHRGTGNRITQILNGRRAVTDDTALRLGHFFGTSGEFWLNLQKLCRGLRSARTARRSPGYQPWTRPRTCTRQADRPPPSGSRAFLPSPPCWMSPSRTSTRYPHAAYVAEYPHVLDQLPRSTPARIVTRRPLVAVQSTAAWHRIQRLQRQSPTGSPALPRRGKQLRRSQWSFSLSNSSRRRSARKSLTVERIKTLRVFAGHVVMPRSE